MPNSLILNTYIPPIPLQANGGTPPYTWGAVGLPPGLSIVNGMITGTVTAIGTYNVTVTVTDSTLATADTSFQIVVSSPPVAITSYSHLFRVFDAIEVSDKCIPNSVVFADTVESTLYINSNILEELLKNISRSIVEITESVTPQYVAASSIIMEDRAIVPNSESLVSNTVLWSGDATARTISVDLNNSHVDIVWFYRRSGAVSYFFDSVRGATKYINFGGLEVTQSNSITAFNTDSFSIGNWSVINGISAISNIYVAWCFSKNSLFDIVTFTGSGGTQVLSHNLRDAPTLIMVQNLDIVEGFLYHNSLGASQSFMMASTPSIVTSMAWGGMSPSYHSFMVGDNANTLGSRYVAYLFTVTTGIYTGNGTTQTITNGFQPGRLLIFSEDSLGNPFWALFDNVRDPVNPRTKAAELIFDERLTASINFNSNGFTLNNGDEAINQSGRTYYYVYL